MWTLLLASSAACVHSLSTVPGLLPSGALETLATDGSWPTTAPKPSNITAQPLLGTTADLGAHRATVTLNARGSSVSSAQPALAVVELTWRRRDVQPQTKDISVVFRTNSSSGAAPLAVTNRVVLSVNGSTGRILLDGSNGAGVYDIYYLPLVSNGAAFGRKDGFQPMRRNGSSSAVWLSAVGAAGWKLDEAADGENSPVWIAAHTSLLESAGTVTYEAQTGHDLFTNMEVAATQGELAALFAGVAGAPALIIPYDNQNVVRTFAFVSTKYLSYQEDQPVWSLPDSIELEAAPNQYLTWQVAIVAVFQGAKWANITNIRLAFSDLVTSGGGSSIPSANVTCFNTDGVDQTGEAFAMRPSLNTTFARLLIFFVAHNQQ